MVKLLSAFAPAKINLFLRVIGRRADGYHELDSLFVPITLGDRVALEARDGRPGAVSIRGNLGDLPADERNLAVRAAHAFVAEFGCDRELVIELHKAIPAGAGLGGGSSDAGAVLRMLAAMSRVKADAPNLLMSRRMVGLAAKLGADVPFFLAPAPAHVRGIGERIIPVAAPPALPIVLAVPPIEAPTALVYRELEPADWSGPAPEADVAALLAGDFRAELMVNDLARAAIARWPEIGRVKALFETLGARAAAMTGSGAGVFGIFRSFEESATVAAELRQREPALRVFPATLWSA